jgi:hypothetical protein
MDQLKNQRTSSDDSTAPREEITPDDRLQDRRLAGRLGADDDDLWEVNCIAADGVECVLELVDEGD